MVSNARFFRADRQSAAILKHGVLQRYLAQFAGMTGGMSAGGRVGYIDAYAGAGVYVSEGSGRVTPGSPKIALDIANGLRPRKRILECAFIERGKVEYLSLEQVIRDSGNASATSYFGDVRKHMPAALLPVTGVPLLVFIDPFGTALETDVVVDSIMDRPGGTVTEVLLNFSMEAVRRIGGRYFESEGTQGREATLRRLDSWLGGPWWRAVLEAHRSAPEAERVGVGAEAVFREYVTHVNRLARTSSFAVPILRQAGLKPIFYLVLFFRKTYALPPFNEAVSKASEEWRENLHEMDLALADDEDSRQPTLPGFSLVDELKTVFEHDEEELKRQAVDQIKDSIKTHIVGRRSLSVRNNFLLVYGDALGEGRELHLRAAWKELAIEGLVVAPPKGGLSAASIQNASR